MVFEGGVVEVVGEGYFGLLNCFFFFFGIVFFYKNDHFIIFSSFSFLSCLSFFLRKSTPFLD